ncbi:DUF5781 family protein [Salinirubellus salinus]|jgi:hypothetical protein|uniref:DUF5781 family protein n=1 Tax=Salinirubellus salinus TaxID=1364945 RepID=A0A9E7R1L0_9EURY|nr:DUF5781 family protein [Salinirubellus salinus]UWM53198.1 DUF5781 family protein [Salinirubellus salinus]
MDVRVMGRGPAEPFLSARDLFETEHDLAWPVEVEVREDPDERTLTGHYDDSHHVLIMSEQAARGAMARELALHEYSHMLRYEQAHPSHTQSTEEALFLALTGRSVERRKLAHCYQIANHMKDIYADDITLDVAPADKLVSFLESSLATALADRPGEAPNGSTTSGSRRLTPAADPEITVVNAAFALALCERHELVGEDHRLYDLARAAASDAPGVRFDRFKHAFRSLADDPDPSDYRKALVDVTREYAT